MGELCGLNWSVSDAFVSATEPNPASSHPKLSPWWLMKLEAPKICWQSAIAPSWLDWTACAGMSWSMEINVNCWDWERAGGWWSRGMEANERENVPLISVKTDRRPADTVAAAAGGRGSELTSASAPEDSCSVILPPKSDSFYWVSERSVHIKWLPFYWAQGEGRTGESKSNHSKWNKSGALKVLAPNTLLNCPD